MNVLFFLIITLIVHSIPFPLSGHMLRPNMLIKWLPLRLVWGTAAWLVICLLMSMTLPWAIIGLLLSFSLLLMIAGGFRPGEMEDMIQGLRMPLVCLGFIMLLVLPTVSGLISWTSDVANAELVDEFIDDTDSPLFNSSIPDNMVRLVTAEFAEFEARKRLAAIGSNLDIAAAHITTRSGRLVWVCTVVSTNVLAENFIKAFIVVDANDPGEVEVIEGVTIPVGEGLFWDKNIQFGNYIEDMTNAYEYAYPTWDPVGNMVYVQTRTQLGWDFVERPLGPKVYCENGTIVTYNTLDDTPDWITQAYSEEWLERQISRWGGYRRGPGFDLFAGGLLWFIPPSNDRLEMTEDTRYILNPDTNRVEAFIAVNPPAASPLSLSGMIRATTDGIYYHDLSAEGLSSGSAAINEVIKDFPDPVSGSYEGAMPLIYPVQINSTYSRLAWYCPIYWWDAEYDEDMEDWYVSDIKLHALGMADAEDVTISFTESGDLSGADLVQFVREGYVQAVRNSLDIGQETGDYVEISATVLNTTSFVEDGNTHIVLRTSNATYEWIEGAAAWMNMTDWYTLLTIGVGDSFTASIQSVDGVYRILTFVKN